MTPKDTLQCLTQLSSEKLLPVTDGNKYIIYIQTICRLKDPGRVNLIWMFLSNPSPQISGNPAEEEEKRRKRDRKHHENKVL